MSPKGVLFAACPGRFFCLARAIKFSACRTNFVILKHTAKVIKKSNQNNSYPELFSDLFSALTFGDFVCLHTVTL